MKKILFVIALGVFAACGGGAGSASTADSTAKDSASSMMAVDSTKKDTTKMMADTTKKDTVKMAMDTTKMKMKGKKK